MSIKVTSFGFKYGVSTESDLVFDVRCLPNPYYIPELRHHTGCEKCVQDYVMSFEQSQTLMKKLKDLLDFLIPCIFRRKEPSGDRFRLHRRKAPFYYVHRADRGLSHFQRNARC